MALKLERVRDVVHIFAERRSLDEKTEKLTFTVSHSRKADGFDVTALYYQTTKGPPRRLKNESIRRRTETVTSTNIDDLIEEVAIVVGVISAAVAPRACVAPGHLARKRARQILERT